MNKPRTEFSSKLAKPAQRALSEAGITSLEQITEMTKDEVMKLHGMGPKAVEQLCIALAEKDLSFVKKIRTEGFFTTRRTYYVHNYY